MNALSENKTSASCRWFEVCDLAYPDRSRPKWFRVEDPEPWEINILMLISQQGAIPLDQLARFLAYSLVDVERVVAHLVNRGYAECREVMAEESSWIWLTKQGARVSGTGLCYRALFPGACNRARAVNEVRLYLAERAPQARWISHRQLKQAHGRRSSVPNAVLEIGTERHAIEVRISNNNMHLLRRMIEMHFAQHDAVVCFCLPRTQQFLESLKKKHGWSKVLIRDLPGGA